MAGTACLPLRGHKADPKPGVRPKKESTLYSGNCLCNGVCFRILCELEPIQICHCSQCRKAQGTPFATNTPVKETAFQLDSGAELLKSFEASPGKQRVFCSTCGSPIYSKKDALPRVLRIRAGLINEPLSSKPAAHFYTDSKANWWPINDDLPQSEVAYDPPNNKASENAAASQFSQPLRDYKFAAGPRVMIQPASSSIGLCKDYE